MSSYSHGPHMSTHNKVSALQKNPEVLVAIANGSEEIEAVSVIDVLRRAGISVTVGKVGTSMKEEQKLDEKTITHSGGFSKGNE